MFYNQTNAGPDSFSRPHTHILSRTPNGSDFDECYELYRTSGQCEAPADLEPMPRTKTCDSRTQVCMRNNLEIRLDFYMYLPAIFSNGTVRYWLVRAGASEPCASLCHYVRQSVGQNDMWLESYQRSGTSRSCLYVIRQQDGRPWRAK